MKEAKTEISLSKVIIILGIFLTTFLIASPVLSEEVIEPSDLEIGFLYYKTSKLPIPWDHFANHYTEYRSARDEFQRMDAMEKIKPLLEDIQRRVLKANLFIVRFRTRVGEYDFENGGFPIEITDTTYLPIPTSRSNMGGPNFAIEFINGHKYSILKVSKEEARKRIVFLRDSRQVVIEVEFVPKAAEEKRIDLFRTYRFISAEIKRIKVFSEKGQLLGEMGPQ